MKTANYEKLVEQMCRNLFDRDTSPGAEPEALLKLDIPALVIPGKDESHATSAARYLEECLPRSEYWDVPPEGQTGSECLSALTRFLDLVARLTSHRYGIADWLAPAVPSRYCVPGNSKKGEFQ